MNQNPNQPGGDVNLVVIGTGLGTTCGLGCLLIMVFIATAFVVGVESLRSHPAAVALMGFAGGLVVYTTVGYVTAYTARVKAAPVNLHIFIVGGIIVLARLTFALIHPQGRHLAPVRDGGGHPIVFVSILLIIPMMLLGASLVKKGWNPVR